MVVLYQRVVDAEVVAILCQRQDSVEVDLELLVIKYLKSVLRLTLQSI